MVLRVNDYYLVQEIIPQLLPRLTLENLQQVYKANGKTALQIAHAYGPGPWENIAHSIEKAMRKA